MKETLMKAPALTTIGVSMLLAGSALADTPAMPSTTDHAAKTSKPIKPAKLSCEEFLAFDEVSRPAVVYWAEGVNSKGKPEDGVIDIERTNRLVPVLVDDCKKEPKTSFWAKMKMELQKVF
jgi:acid stress chaperone HdeA